MFYKQDYFVKINERECISRDGNKALSLYYSAVVYNYVNLYFIPFIIATSSVLMSLLGGKE